MKTIRSLSGLVAFLDSPGRMLTVDLVGDEDVFSVELLVIDQAGSRRLPTRFGAAGEAICEDVVMPASWRLVTAATIDFHLDQHEVEACSELSAGPFCSTWSHRAQIVGPNMDLAD